MALSSVFSGDMLTPLLKRRLVTFETTYKEAIENQHNTPEDIKRIAGIVAQYHLEVAPLILTNTELFNLLNYWSRGTSEDKVMVSLVGEAIRPKGLIPFSVTVQAYEVVAVSLGKLFGVGIDKEVREELAIELAQSDFYGERKVDQIPDFVKVHLTPREGMEGLDK